MKILNYLLIKVLFLLSISCEFYAQNAQLPTVIKNELLPHIAFTENKGQVTNQYGNQRPDVFFSGVSEGLLYHLRRSGISYEFSHSKENTSTTSPRSLTHISQVNKADIKIERYRLDINWLNTSNQSTVKTGKPTGGNISYYGSGLKGIISDVKTYEDVFYINIYSNINLHYYGVNNHLKYDFIVAPHANYKQILFEVKGAEKISISEDGSLVFTTPAGKVNEGAPIVYQNKQRLSAKWIVKKNILSFEIENYNPDLELVIDPLTRVWATYYGSSFHSDMINSCATDQAGNVFIAGYAGPSGTAIATSGSHQNTFTGNNYCSFLAKFNSSGVRQWATFYGRAYDQGFSCCTDPWGNVYLAGMTTDTSLIATTSAHQTIYGGNGADGFLAKFNSAGLRLWGTYYGGIGIEQVNSCATDPSGNVYICGNTNSPGNIATLSSHQNSHGGSGFDAFLAKFDSSGVRQWATYYGGTGVDYGACCVTDGAGNIYMAGTSYSGNNISTPGAHQTSHSGAEDGFLVKFNSAGVRQWGTYYGDTLFDAIYSCSTDASGNVYFAGGTLSSSNIATNGAHQTTYAGNEDAFLVKFNSNGIRQWGTYYGSFGGTVNSDNANSVCTDIFGNVIMAGSAGPGTSTEVATVGSYQSACYGTRDAFLVKFNPMGVRLWGTYYGGGNIEEGIACCTDASCSIYLAGTSGSTEYTMVATPASHQPIKSFQKDGFLVRFMERQLFNPVATSTSTQLCSGSSFSLNGTPTNSSVTSFSWSGPSGFSSNIANPVISNANVTNSGTYTFVVTDSLGCLEYSLIEVTVGAIPTIAVNSGSFCAGSSFTLVPFGAATYTFEGGSSIVSPSINTTYTVSGTSSLGCHPAGPATASVYVLPTPSLSLSGQNNVCIGEAVVLTATGANSYFWNTGAITQTLLALATDTLTSYWVKGTSSVNACADSSFFYLIANECAGINEDNFIADQVFVYPNPSHEYFFIQAPGNSEFSLYDYQGRFVCSGKTLHAKTKINIESLAAGVYLMRFFGNLTGVNLHIVKE